MCSNLHWSPRWHPLGELKNAHWLPAPGRGPIWPPFRAPAAPKLAIKAGLDCMELSNACSASASTSPGGALGGGPNPGGGPPRGS